MNKRKFKIISIENMAKEKKFSLNLFYNNLLSNGLKWCLMEIVSEKNKEIELKGYITSYGDCKTLVEALDGELIDEE